MYTQDKGEKEIGSEAVFILYFSEFRSHQNEILGWIAGAIPLPTAADMQPCVQFPAVTCCV